MKKKIDRFTAIIAGLLVLAGLLIIFRPVDKPESIQLVHFNDDGTISAVDDFKTVENGLDKQTKLWYNHYKGEQNNDSQPNP